MPSCTRTVRIHCRDQTGHGESIGPLTSKTSDLSALYLCVAVTRVKTAKNQSAADCVESAVGFVVITGRLVAMFSKILKSLSQSLDLAPSYTFVDRASLLRCRWLQSSQHTLHLNSRILATIKTHFWSCRTSLNNIMS
jgi:hypothetical protein